MKRFLLIAAAFTVLLGGCGKEEEPQRGQAEQAAMEESTGMVTEGAPTEESTMTPPETVKESAGEVTGAVESMADEAAVAEEAATAEAVDEAASAAGQLVASAEQMVQAEGGRGKEVYDMVCFACHTQGIAGAPMLGDKALWESRIAKGMDTLANNAVNGFQGSAGVMPPKGGRMDLSDEDVKAAVIYMVDQVK